MKKSKYEVSETEQWMDVHSHNLIVRKLERRINELESEVSHLIGGRGV